MMFTLALDELDPFTLMLAGFDNSILTLSTSITAQLSHSLTNERRGAIAGVVRAEIENAREAIGEYYPEERLGKQGPF